MFLLTIETDATAPETDGDATIAPQGHKTVLSPAAPGFGAAITRERLGIPRERVDRGNHIDEDTTLRIDPVPNDP
jgi:hypothetical protein